MRISLPDSISMSTVVPRCTKVKGIRVMADGKKSYVDSIDQDPFPFYEELLAQTCPVQWDSGMKAWLVTDYEAVKEVGRKDDAQLIDTQRVGERAANLVGGPRVVQALQGE